MNQNPRDFVVGPTNVTNVLVNGKKLQALVDTGAQVSTMTLTTMKKLGLKFVDIDAGLNLQGTGGFEIPYKGCTIANLRIPGIKRYNREVYFTVLDDKSKNAEEVPLQLGTIVIDDAIMLMTETEITNCAMTWRRARISSLISKSAREAAENADKITGTLSTFRSVTVPPLSMKRVEVKSQVRGLQGRVDVLAQQPDKPYSMKVVTASTLCELTAGSSKAVVELYNGTTRPVVIPAKTKVATIEPATALPRDLKKEDLDQVIKDRFKSAENEAGSPEGSATDSAPEQGGLGHPTGSTTANTTEKAKPLTVEERKVKLRQEIDLTSLEEEGYHEEAERVRELLCDYHEQFCLDKNELGHVNLVKHKIRMEDYTPIKERPRRIPPSQYDEVKSRLQEMLDVGAIRPSNSPWASAVVLAKKKDGSWRMCVDLRKVNKRTIKDAYALPRIDEALDSLNGSKWFTSLDLKCGYWQVEMDEESKKFTAFTVGPLGFYECQRMPFGLTNAPATFQRLMETCLGDLHLAICIIYLDDIVIFSGTLDQHIERLKKVLDKLKAAGLKLKPSKCDFFRRKITYLGHVVSEHGVETDPEKVKAVKEWPVPDTVTAVRSFLGFANHYRRFLKGYATIAKPLNKLISGDNAKKKNDKVEWEEEHQKAFQGLKDLLSSAPVLAYADYKKPFTLNTDASGHGLGAALYQKDENGHERPIAYASRSLAKSEKKYPAHKMEFLALKWAVTDKFHEYLYGAKFDVYTDNNPLTYVLTSAKLDAAGHRWVGALANYDFKLFYKKGSANVDADALSRIEWESVDNPAVHCIVKAAKESGSKADSYMNHSVPEYIQSATKCTSQITVEEWQQHQAGDKAIREILELHKSKKLFGRAAKQTDSKELSCLLKQRTKLKVRQGLLYRVVHPTNKEEKVFQFVVPFDFRVRAMEGCHDKVGHLGQEKCLDLLRDRFYWPNMTKDMEEHITSCERCIKFKAKPVKAPMETIRCTQPMELLHIDFLVINQGVGRERKTATNILVITDHFTRYARAYVCPNQKASTTAEVLWEEFFCHYGFPEKIISDQGGNFESKLVQELCRVSGIKKLRTTPYHPQCNGQVEKFNSTLIRMLGTLEPDEKMKWKKQVPHLVHAYNCCRQCTTGFSPFHLFYGREPRLAIDAEFGVKLSRKGFLDKGKFVEKLQQKLRWAQDIAIKADQKESARYKRYYDRKAKTVELKTGDIVLVRERLSDKIQDKWGDATYVVISRPYENLPVYQVQPTEGGKCKTLHRNQLLQLLQDSGPDSASEKASEAQQSDEEVDSEDETSSSDDKKVEPKVSVQAKLVEPAAEPERTKQQVIDWATLAMEQLSSRFRFMFEKT